MSTQSVSLEHTSHVQKWIEYRDTRVGDYEFRSRTRYRAVATVLFNLGLNDSHSVADIGAGEEQFGWYLCEHGWQGEYRPHDAVIDGTDLEMWVPDKSADFTVCIEVIEHLSNPMRLVQMMQMFSKQATIITTPNPDVVDVISCDPTHVSSISEQMLQAYKFQTVPMRLFGKPGDTILAHWRRK